jgi:hypothetical protein
MTRVGILSVLILFFACGKQKSKNEPSVTSILDSSKIEMPPKIVDRTIQIKERDTVIVNGHKLTFQPTDSVAMTEIFGDEALRRQMTDTISNWHQRATFIERYLSKKFKNYFLANDSILFLFLADNKQISFPKWDAEKDEGYNFEHYFSSIDYFLLHVQWGEGNCWMLVNRKNGFKKYIIGKTYVSLDAKKIFIINSDLLAGYSDTGMELLSISGDTLKTEFKLDVKNWGPIGAKWLSDNKIIIEKDFP